MASSAKTAGAPVTWRDALLGLVFLLGIMSGFGAWVISRAESAAVPNATAIERVETKVDGVLLLLIQERAARGERSIPESVEKAMAQ